MQCLYLAGTFTCLPEQRKCKFIHFIHCSKGIEFLLSLYHFPKRCVTGKKKKNSLFVCFLLWTMAKVFDCGIDCLKRCYLYCLLSPLIHQEVIL